MYLPKHFEQPDIGVLHNLIRSRPFASLVTMTSGGLDANHLPFIIRHDPAPLGTLHGHVARGNPVWRESDVKALVIFQGPERYISPSLYPSKKEHGKVVPTWNYAVVHAHGTLHAREDVTWIRTHVEELVVRNEEGRPDPWSVTDAPADFIDRMVQGIVGIEIRIERLVGKWKVSQNRERADREGVVEGLSREGTASALAMADLVRAMR